MWWLVLAYKHIKKARQRWTRRLLRNVGETFLFSICFVCPLLSSVAFGLSIRFYLYMLHHVDLTIDLGKVVSFHWWKVFEVFICIRCGNKYCNQFGVEICRLYFGILVCFSLMDTNIITCKLWYCVYIFECDSIYTIKNFIINIVCILTVFIFEK